MRTTLNIEDDVLFAVRERARREGRSIGAVLSDLARQALLGLADVEPSVGESHGFAPLPHRGPVVSNEFVDRLREEGSERAGPCAT